MRVPANDWTLWTGGECPVAAGALIDLKYRDGGVRTAVIAGNYRWYHIDKHGAREADIVAYRQYQRQE